MYVKTVHFEKTVIDNLDEFYGVIYNAPEEEGFCETDTDNMLMVSNQEFCLGTKRSVGYYFKIMLPVAEDSSYCFKTPVDFGLGGLSMWDGEIMK